MYTAGIKFATARRAFEAPKVAHPSRGHLPILALGRTGSVKRFFAGPDRNFEPVLGRRKWAAPGRVVRAVGIVGVVEVDHHVVAMRVYLEIAASAICLLP